MTDNKLFTLFWLQVVLVTGAAGGSKITTGTTLIAINNLIYGKSIKEAIDEPRFHHQLFPMSIDYEFGLTAVSTVQTETLSRRPPLA